MRITGGDASAAFGVDVAQALTAGIPLVLAHEMPDPREPQHKLGSNAAGRCPCEFADFFLPTQTPEELLKAGIYDNVAVAFKGGAWRQASRTLFVEKVAEHAPQTAKPRTDVTRMLSSFIVDILSALAGRQLPIVTFEGTTAASAGSSSTLSTSTLSSSTLGSSGLSTATSSSFQDASTSSTNQAVAASERLSATRRLSMTLDGTRNKLRPSRCQTSAHDRAIVGQRRRSHLGSDDDGSAPVRPMTATSRGGQFTAREAPPSSRMRRSSPSDPSEPVEPHPLPAPHGPGYVSQRRRNTDRSGGSSVRAEAVAADDGDEAEMQYLTLVRRSASGSGRVRI